MLVKQKMLQMLFLGDFKHILFNSLGQKVSGPSRQFLLQILVFCLAFPFALLISSFNRWTFGSGLICASVCFLRLVSISFECFLFTFQVCRCRFSIEYFIYLPCADHEYVCCCYHKQQDCSRQVMNQNRSQMVSTLWTPDGNLDLPSLYPYTV